MQLRIDRHDKESLSVEEVLNPHGFHDYGNWYNSASNAHELLLVRLPPLLTTLKIGLGEVPKAQQGDSL